MADAIDVEQLAAIRRGQTAIREAVARFGASFLPMADVDKAYIACTEATLWIQRLDLLLHEGDETYRRRRDADDQGRVIPGLRWARNRYVHDAISILIVSPARPRLLGAARALNEPLYGGRMEAKWLDRAKVPREAYREDPRAEESYDQHVAGRPVAETLADAAAFLFERGLPESFSEQFPDWG